MKSTDPNRGGYSPKVQWIEWVEEFLFEEVVLGVRVATRSMERQRQTRQAGDFINPNDLLAVQKARPRTHNA